MWNLYINVMSPSSHYAIMQWNYSTPSSRLCLCTGSVQLVLQRPASYTWPKFIYADDICFTIQGQFFSELECSLSSDMARMSHFCRQWRLKLKPSASKTISSVFHLHNTSATRELSAYLGGQRFRHECHPTYLGVTLDRIRCLTENTWRRLQASWRTETTCW